MAARKQFFAVQETSPELKVLLEQVKGKQVSDIDLFEQRISFAFGNAIGSELITKESVRNTSRTIRLVS
jgi:hypothetical protein